MGLINSILTWVMKKRIHQIELFKKYPHDVQEEWFRKLIHEASRTEFGKKYGYSDIETPAQFRERVPVSTYEHLFPYIQRLMCGEHKILLHTATTRFSQSSCTPKHTTKHITRSQ